MLLGVHEPPPMAKLAVPHDWPEGETTSMSCVQVALASGKDMTAYPRPPCTMCSRVFARARSHEGAGEIEVASGSNWPSQTLREPENASPSRKSPSPTRSKKALGRAGPDTAWNSGPGAPP